MLPLKRIHFIGIGGVGMSAVAWVILKKRIPISGSDVQPNIQTARLEKEGVPVYYGHSPENVKDAGLIVVSSAIHEDNPELVQARNLKIPIWHRSDMLEEILSEGESITVAGTHGKTSTASMAALVLERAGLDPTFIIGGDLNELGGNARLGAGKYIVAEADESDGTFLSYHPQYAIVTNVEPDHLDFYKTADGHYLSFGGLEPQFFAAFCNAIGRPDWIAGGVAPPDCAGVKEEVRKIIKSKTRGEWKEIFDKTDACVEPVLSLSEALDSELVRERQLTTDITLPDGSTVRQPASPFKFSATPPVYGKTGVKAGSHNREVFLELGYSEEEINEFGKTGLFS